MANKQINELPNGLQISNHTRFAVQHSNDTTENITSVMIKDYIFDYEKKEGNIVEVTTSQLSNCGTDGNEFIELIAAPIDPNLAIKVDKVYVTKYGTASDDFLNNTIWSSNNYFIFGSIPYQEPGLYDLFCDAGVFGAGSEVTLVGLNKLENGPIRIYNAELKQDAGDMYLSITIFYTLVEISRWQ